jgi:hypothetical protein
VLLVGPFKVHIVIKIVNCLFPACFNLFDIGRSHVIRKVTNGRSQVIFKFLSYRMRNSVYTNKKAPKGDPHGIFCLFPACFNLFDINSTIRCLVCINLLRVLLLKKFFNQLSPVISEILCYRKYHVGHL